MSNLERTSLYDTFPHSSIERIGGLMYGNATRLAVALALGQHFTQEGNVGIQTQDLIYFTQRSSTAVRGQLQVLQEASLVQETGVESSKRKFQRAVESPAWEVIRQTARVISPGLDSMPNIEPVVLDVNTALNVRRRLFGERLLPQVGVLFADMTDEHPVTLRDFMGSDPYNSKHPTSVIRVFSRLRELGVIQPIDEEANAEERRYLPTDSPLLDPFRALGRIIPQELHMRIQ